MNILVLCTGNSARSILLEVLLNDLGNGRIRAWSAGSHPTGRVNPFALDLLAAKGHPTEGLRSKSWDEFARPDAPKMDLVITVCASAAGETCPFWPGAPITAHWGVDDPAAIVGTDAVIRQGFEAAYGRLRRRAEALLSLDFQAMDKTTLKSTLVSIGEAH